jgi:hypothetical protein
MADKLHTTNYYNTFIEIAADCPAVQGEIPPLKGGSKTVAGMQFDMVYKHPYKFTSDDIFFQVYADRNDLTEEEYAEARKEFFSRGQPCFRASPLTKRYGWGIHSDDQGRVAIYGCESPQYRKFTRDASLKVVKAMKSGRG